MDDERVELKIDVFDKMGQVAKVLKTLTIRLFIEEILQEFEEFEFLDRQNSGNYLVRRKDENEPLDPARTVADHHLNRGAELVFQEKSASVPAGTSAMSRNVYLKAKGDGKVFKLAWYPALIGRSDPRLAQNERLAVNLESFEKGLRVSRRHAKIVEQDGRYFIESLSSNPTLLNNDPTPITRHALHHGDEIHLEQSQIILKFIVRDA